MLNLSNLFLFFTLYNDAPEPWQFGFQDSATPGFAGIIELHNTIFFYLIVIGVGVFWVLGSLIFYFNSRKFPIIHKYLNHGTLIELIWTITPALILIAIAFPSFRLLYLLDEVIQPTISIKVVGHQWYWSYEYSDYVTESGESIEFDSYMVPDSDLELGQFRLLEVDNKIIVPVDCHIRLIVTGADVLHAFAIPAVPCLGSGTVLRVIVAGIDRTFGYFGTGDRLFIRRHGDKDRLIDCMYKYKAGISPKYRPIFALCRTWI